MTRLIILIIAKVCRRNVNATYRVIVSVRISPRVNGPLHCALVYFVLFQTDREDKAAYICKGPNDHSVDTLVKLTYFFAECDVSICFYASCSLRFKVRSKVT